MKLALSQVAHLIGAAVPAGAGSQTLVEGYSIDSRTLRPGDLFFAIRGERDGHDFLEAAFAAGAVAAVAARDHPNLSGRLLLVPDPRGSLQRLAALVRRRWDGSVVAVTGSNGKTTTKEIIAALLATQCRVAKSEGNLNNDLGLPLSLLRMDDEAEVAVLEMGMNHRGEIRELAEIAQPTVGVVTNVNAVHLEFFHSVDEIALAKRELIETLRSEATAVLNADDPRVSAFAPLHSGEVLTYGIEKPAGVRAERIEELGPRGTRFYLEDCPDRFQTPLPGRHNLYNTLAGLAAAWALGVSPRKLVEAVASLQPVRMRGEIQQIGPYQVINDCYNSNPRAAEAMLDLLASLPARRRVAVLGEMLELGENAEQFHAQVGRRVARNKVDLLAGVCGAARYIADEAVRAGLPAAAAHFFSDPREAGEFLRKALQPGDAVLFKASRGVRLEQALELLKSHTEGGG
jgi:UDP-N-acetylmuramoyl-tripeptide--D-alanyl-D-alanine ligase